MRKIIAVLLLFAAFTSCIPLKKQVYFQGDLEKNDSLAKIQDQPYRLQVDDMLDIQIKSSDENVTKTFNPSVSEGTNNNIGIMKQVFTLTPIQWINMGILDFHI